MFPKNKINKSLMSLLLLLLGMLILLFMFNYQAKRDEAISTDFRLLEEKSITDRYYVVSVLIPTVDEDNYKNLTENAILEIQKQCRGVCDYHLFDHKKAYLLWKTRDKEKLAPEEKNFLAKHYISMRVYDVLDTTYYPEGEQY